MNTENERYSYIDALRGIAIIFVVLFHYTFHYGSDYLLSINDKSNFAKYGWSGVDIFFYYKWVLHSNDNYKN